MLFLFSCLSAYFVVFHCSLYVLHNYEQLYIMYNYTLCHLTIGNHIGTGTIFSIGGAKLVKSNQDNQIQNMTLCNAYFSKKIYTVYSGVWGKAPRSSGEFSRIFVLQVTLQSKGLLLTVSYSKKIWAAGCITWSPNNYVGGAQGAPLHLPVSAPMGGKHRLTLD